MAEPGEAGKGGVAAWKRGHAEGDSGAGRGADGELLRDLRGELPDRRDGTHSYSAHVNENSNRATRNHMWYCLLSGSVGPRPR